MWYSIFNFITFRIYNNLMGGLYLDPLNFVIIQINIKSIRIYDKVELVKIWPPKFPDIPHLIVYIYDVKVEQVKIWPPKFRDIPNLIIYIYDIC